jgi:hypothetical protein
MGVGLLPVVSKDGERQIVMCVVGETAREEKWTLVRTCAFSISAFACTILDVALWITTMAFSIWFWAFSIMAESVVGFG